MTACQTHRGPFAALALAAALTCSAGAASAATVQVTVDFEVFADDPPSPYIEDGFEVSGAALGMDPFGNPDNSMYLDFFTPTLTVTRTGGGIFSLVSFDYLCPSSGCSFSVGSTSITSASGGLPFTTATPSGFTDITSLVFTWNGTGSSVYHYIDNIVLSYNDAAPIPLPAGLPLLLGGLAGLGLLARRKGRVG